MVGPPPAGLPPPTLRSGTTGRAGGCGRAVSSGPGKARDDAGEQGVRGRDDRVALVGQGVLEHALHVRADVAEVAGEQRGAEVGAHHGDVPLAAHRVVGRQGGPAHARDRLDGQVLAERADEAGPGHEVAVALGRGRREVPGLLEGRRHDAGLAQSHGVALELLAHLDEQRLGGAAQRCPGGQAVERRAVQAGQRSRPRQHQLGDRVARGRPGRRAPEHPALAEAGAEGPGHDEVLLRLDALREHEGAGALGVVVDGVHDLRDGLPRTLLHQAQVQLHDVRAQQRHERERQRLGAHVVERHGPAEGAHPLDRAQQVGRTGGEGALGDLEHHPQLAGGRLGDGEQVLERRRVEHLRLDVDEQRERGQQPLLDRTGEGRPAAQVVELGEAAAAAGGGEQRVRALQRTHRPARERLVRDDGTAVEVDDRLEDGADGLVRQDVVQGVHAQVSACRDVPVAPRGGDGPSQVSKEAYTCLPPGTCSTPTSSATALTMSSPRPDSWSVSTSGRPCRTGPSGTVSCTSTRTQPRSRRRSRRRGGRP
jgi:hypothetical protein